MGKNYLYLAGAEMASKVITFAAIAFLARVVGPAAYGYFEFAAAALFCAGLIVDQGLGPYGAREIAKAPGRTNTLLWQIVALRFGLALLATGAVLGFAFAFEHPPVVTQLLLIYAFDLLLMPLLLQWVFQGHDEMGTVAALQVIRQTLFGLVIFAFVREASQVWFVAVAEGVGVAGAAVYGIIVYVRRFGFAWERHFSIPFQVLRESIPIGLAQIFWVVRMYGATLLVGLIAPPQEVGYFGAGLRIFVALHAFIYLYFFNLLPTLARTWQARDASFEKLVARHLRHIAWLCVLVVPLWIVTAPFVITAAYGADFAPAAGVLQWLGIAFGAAWIDGHYRFGLIAAGQQKAEMQAQLLGAVAAIVLIPVLYTRAGLNGTGLALVLAELVVWATTWWFARTRLQLRGHARLLLRPAVGMLGAAGLLWLTTGLPLAARVVALTGVLGCMVFVLDSELRLDWVSQIHSMRAQLRERVARLARIRSI